jgi:hypothetical protein
MATVQNTLIGRASGSVGEVVFLTWKLINITRAKPASVANPDTVPQQTQRNMFGQVVGLFQVLKPILKVGLANRNRKMTIFNRFQKFNMPQAFQDVGGGLVALVPENLKISYGLMVKTPIASIDSLGGDASVDLVWESVNIPLGSSLNDIAYAFVINQTQGTFAYAFGQLRQNDIMQLDFSSNNQIGDILQAYLFFVSPDGKKISDNSWLQHEVVA